VQSVTREREEIFSTSCDTEKRSRALRREDINWRISRAHRVFWNPILARVYATSCFLLCRNASLFFRPTPFPPCSASLYPSGVKYIRVVVRAHARHERNNSPRHARKPRLSVTLVTYTRIRMHVHNARRLGPRKLRTYYVHTSVWTWGWQGGIEISRPVGRCSTCMLRARPME